MSTGRRTSRRVGFTLIEMVVSLAVFAVLVGAMGSALVLSTHALPTRTSAAGRTVAASEVLQQMTDELRGALYLTEAEPTSVALVLPDRDGDGNPEAVRYAWSGLAGGAGGALTRRLNGGPAAVVLDKIAEMRLTYPTVDHVRELPGVRTESGEVLLSKSDSGSAKWSFAVDGDDWTGFRISPLLPAEAIEWRTRRVLVRAQTDGLTDAVVRFEMTGWADGRPAAGVVDATDVAESSLASTWAWHQVNYDQGGPWSPGQVAAVTLKKVSGGGKAAAIHIFSQDAASNLHRTYDGGASWIVDNDDSAMLHYAYGTYTTEGPAWTLTRRRVVAVDLSLDPGGGAAALAASVELTNAPDAVSRREADFDADPSKQDLDLDGQTDWKGKDKAFKQSQFAGGVWSLAVEGQINPSNPPLDEPLTLDVWLEDTTADGYAGWAEARFDRGGGTCGQVRLSVNRVGSTQRFRIELTRAGGGVRTLLEAERPVGVSAKLGVVVDPSGDRVVGSIDDAVGLCLPYDRVGDDDKEPSLRLAAGHEEFSGVRVRHIALRVGGEVADVQVATGSGGGGVIGGLFSLFRR